jgi:hypothetical protein
VIFLSPALIKSSSLCPIDVLLSSLHDVEQLDGIHNTFFRGALLITDVMSLLLTRESQQGQQAGRGRGRRR